MSGNRRVPHDRDCPTSRTDHATTVAATRVSGWGSELRPWNSIAMPPVSE
jgi:hypothetical protein